MTIFSILKKTMLSLSELSHLAKGCAKHGLNPDLNTDCLTPSCKLQTPGCSALNIAAVVRK